MKKVLITAAVAATILTTSIGVYAASNATLGTKISNATVSSKNQLDIAKDISNNHKYIEYTKTTSIRADGSQGMIFEQWDDPKTFDSRIDNILKIDGKVDYTSSYSKDSGKTMVILHRDETGKAVSGKIEAVNQKGADYNNSLLSKRSFAAIKAQYKSDEWTVDGTDKTSDGKTLEKVSKTYKNIEKKGNVKLSTNNASTTTMKEVAYLDLSTGLPTKTELYQEVNGKMNLIDTKVYEFKYIDTAGNIFDTNGVNLKQLPQFNYDENAKG